MSRINQFQPLAYLFQPHSTSTFILPGLRMIAVKDLTSHRTIRMPKDRDTDKTVYRGADTMLEGIFYQRYENKGSDLQRTSRICLQIHTHFYLLWQADTHQSYIITDKVQFFFKRNKSLLIVIKHMPQLNPEKPDVPLNKNDAFQKVQKRRVQENGERGPIQHDQSPPFFFHLNPL